MGCNCNSCQDPYQLPQGPAGAVGQPGPPGNGGGVGTRGPVGITGNQGVPGNDGNDGKGWTAGAYNSSTGIATFASNDGLGFATGDLRGEDGDDGLGIVDTTYAALTTLISSSTLSPGTIYRFPYATRHLINGTTGVYNDTTTSHDSGVGGAVTTFTPQTEVILAKAITTTSLETFFTEDTIWIKLRLGLQNIILF